MSWCRKYREFAQLQADAPGADKESQQCDESTVQSIPCRYWSHRMLRRFHVHLQWKIKQPHISAIQLFQPAFFYSRTPKIRYKIQNVTVLIESHTHGVEQRSFQQPWRREGPLKQFCSLLRYFFPSFSLCVWKYQNIIFPYAFFATAGTTDELLDDLRTTEIEFSEKRWFYSHSSARWSR